MNEPLRIEWADDSYAKTWQSPAGLTIHYYERGIPKDHRFIESLPRSKQRDIERLSDLAATMASAAKVVKIPRRTDTK